MVYKGYYRNYNLAGKLGQGGEGAVFEIEGSPDKVAKIYHEAKLSADRELEGKIRTMIQQPVRSFMGDVLTVTWPQDALFDHNGKFRGYVMPKVSNMKHLFAARRERERKELFPAYNLMTATVIARNLAVAVNHIHQAGTVIGDFNPNNIMVDRKGHITLIDADSFSVTDKIRNKTYKCCVSVPEYVAPELQNKNWCDRSSVFTEASDNFALAIHIFMLLMNNYHPFGCNISDKSCSGNDYVKTEDNIVKGICPFVKGNRGLIPPKAPLFDRLPSYIQVLFKRAFIYDYHSANFYDTIKRRPSAMEWADALYRMVNEGSHKSKGLKDKTASAYNEKFNPAESDGASERKGLFSKGILIAAATAVLAFIMLFIYATASDYDRAWNYYNTGNYEKAVRYFVKAADKGNVDAAWDLGCMYCYGDGVNENDEEATYWLAKAAEEGGADYQYNLAWLYYDGEGLERDYKEAYYWFYEAAANGDTYAMNMLAEMLLNGYGVGRDPYLAVAWYSKAADSGNVDSISELIEIYENGLYGMVRNTEESETWKERYKELTGDNYEPGGI